VTIIDTMSGKKRDVAGVIAEFGVPPSLMLDFQALVGDAVDNVPGVPKVGPKTAAKWLQQYGSLDALMAHAHEIKGVVGDNLRASLTWLPQARELLRIKTDCDLSAYIPGFPALDAIAISAPDTEALRPFYEKYGFKTLARALAPAASAAPAGQGVDAAALAQGDPPVAEGVASSGAPSAPSAPLTSPRHYEVVLTWPDFERWLATVQAAELVALDTETTSLDEMRAQIVGISLAVRGGEAAYIPLRHDGPDAPAQLPLDAVLARLQPWLEDAARPKLGQHVKYDRHVFANHGVQVHGYAHDTMLQSYVLEVHKPHNLRSLAERHLGREGINYEDLCGKGAHQIPFAQVAVERAAEYACEDVDECLGVHEALWPLLAASAPLGRIYALEIACSEVLFRMERNGVLIDTAVLAAQSRDLGQRIMEIEAEAYALAGQPFNLGSPKQLAEIFFDKLGMPVIKKPPRARAAPTRRCWKSSQRITRCPPSCSNTAA